MKIAVIGTYWKKYSRNRALIDGLVKSEAQVSELHYEIEPQKTNEPGDIGIKRIIKRSFDVVMSSIFMLQNISKIKKHDVILCLYPGHLDLITAWIIAKVLDKPLIFDSCISLYDSAVIDKHIFSEKSFVSKLLLNFERFLLNLVDLVLVDTKSMKGFLQETLKVKENKLEVIPLGANDNIYKVKNTTRKNSKTEVFFFGLYNPLQGTEFIAKAATILQARDDINITMLGEGPDRTKTKAIAKKHHLKNLQFLDFVPEEELVKHIQNCDIMLGIFANSHIAQRVVPNKVYAGLACKKPVITADHPPMHDFFDHKENIYLCQPENPQSLATAIMDLADNKELRQKVAKKGNNIYKQSFASDVLGRMSLNAIHRLINQQQGNYAHI